MLCQVPMSGRAKRCTEPLSDRTIIHFSLQRANQETIITYTSSCLKCLG